MKLNAHLERRLAKWIAEMEASPLDVALNEIESHQAMGDEIEYAVTDGKLKIHRFTPASSESIRERFPQLKRKRVIRRKPNRDGIVVYSVKDTD